MATEFKIVDRKTGLYSTGGYHPAWVSGGKSWQTLGQVRAHLKLYCRGQYRGERKAVPKTWEVVELEVVSRLVSSSPAADLVSRRSRL